VLVGAQQAHPQAGQILDFGLWILDVGTSERG
jgi:hypothetical protein